MNAATDIGVVEMGANHINEIEFLCNIAFPDYGLITNFGKAHIEGFGSVEGVIQGKSELYEHLKMHNKLIFVNQNDAIQLKQSQHYSNLYQFGTAQNASSTIELESTQPFVKITYHGQTIHSKLAGAYNFNNISVAIAVGTYFNVEPKNIITAIEEYTPTNNRSQILEKGSNKIIMDAYNANPTSMLAALDNFKQLHQDGKLLFLGDMFELGQTAESEHQFIVDYLEKNKVGQVYLVGRNFNNTIVKSESIQKFKDFEALKSHLENHSIQNSYLLIKGSRGMALERILELL
jgi:UDP-N-acetylmuramoyl-tripeptide--D-alanyl-D-alanine ligase